MRITQGSGSTSQKRRILKYWCKCSFTDQTVKLLGAGQLQELKCLYEVKIFFNIINLMFEIHNSKILDAYDKNCWFYERAKLSYFTFKNGKETGTEFIVLWRQFVCSGLFTPCHWGEILRLRKCQVILNPIVSPIYREFLTNIILWRKSRKMLKKLKFWNCVFQTLYFYLFWNFFSLHRHFK